MASTSAHMSVQAVGYYQAATKTYQYRYAPDGLRSTKTAPDGTLTRFTWDRSRSIPLLLAEAIDAPGGTANDKTIRYVYGPDGRVVADVTTPAAGAEVTRWYHHDQLGTTRALIDNTGAILATYAYTPYGEPAGQTGSATTPIGWAGEYRDAETGLTYLRARYYDAATGQFITRDPIESTTRSAYGYAGGNPANYIDPSGLSECGDLSFGGLVDCGSKVSPVEGQTVADFAGGTLDAITFGHGEELLSLWGDDDKVRWGSTANRAGYVAGNVIQTYRGFASAVVMGANSAGWYGGALSDCLRAGPRACAMSGFAATANAVAPGAGGWFFGRRGAWGASLVWDSASNLFAYC